VLNLASATAPDWLPRALAGLDALLLDHAHCEKKAASTALGLVFAHPEETQLAAPLSRLAREELEHFELVLDVMDARGLRYGRAEPTPYAAGLREAVRGSGRERLVDVLVCCALVEARSCERMQLLAQGLEDRALASFYESLLASEARHHRSYLDLAETVHPRAKVSARLRELALHEARVLARSPGGPRLHD
jgi:tRNA-(ms[2]io[6]A)-hydroxylase